MPQLSGSPSTPSTAHGRRWRWTAFLFLPLLLLACSTELLDPAPRQAVTVSLLVDGELSQLSSNATNVRELLEEANVALQPADEIDPPLFTPLTNTLQIEVVRVTESIELIEQAIPFDRRIVRNESMSADDPPVIIQAGQPGLQEVTVRLVYRNGLEAERVATQAVQIEAPQDEIVMVGLGAAPGNLSFTGLLAYVSGGNALLLRGSSAFPESLRTGGDLDRRVFVLSPSGSHLLFTRATTATEQFNALYVMATERDATPEPLGIDNVLWADWNPATDGVIAFTTAEKVELLPGWEANNDLWLADVTDATDPLLTQLVEAYPATYGWWGGNYAWSPDGRYLAYSYADEVGLIDTVLVDEEEPATHQRLWSFTEYNTRADWVWVPSLTWSPDSRYFAFTAHGGDNAEALDFDSWVVDVSSGIRGQFVEQAGIWSHPHWSPFAGTAESASNESTIAFLRATNPLDSLRSSYTLWLMDQDGSNAHQVYPQAGENSRFPRDRQFMVWGPGGTEFAFVFNDDLYIHSLASGDTFRLTQDDNVVTQPTWAPYGPAVRTTLPATQIGPEGEATPVRELPEG